MFKDSSFDDLYLVGFTQYAEYSPDMHACFCAQEADTKVTRIRTRSNHSHESPNAWASETATLFAKLGEKQIL